jgi:predicted transcriptional regulator
VTAVKTRSVLSGMTVKEAMRRQVVVVAATETVNRGISRMIKYKSNALLIGDPDGHATGLSPRRT